MSMKVCKFNFGKARGYEVKVYFDSVSGLVKDAPVEIAGVEIGKVSKIFLENGKALVALMINPGIKITKDILMFFLMI